MICFDKKGKKKPKKPCYKLLVLALLVFIASEARAQTVEQDLIGLGMKPEQADYLASILPAGSVLGNNTYLKGRNAANSADINILKINTADDLLIVSDANNRVLIQDEADDNRNFIFNSSSDTALTFTFGDGGTTASQTLYIGGSTSDGDDDACVEYGGGGGAGNTRGSSLTLCGNETSAVLRLNVGDVASSHLDLQMENASSDVRIIDVSAGAIWTFDNDGDINGAAGVAGNLIMNSADKGIQILSGATLDADVLTAASAATTAGYITTNGTAGKFAFVANIADAVGTDIRGFKTRAAANSTNANTIISSGDDILSLTAFGADGAEYINAAQILMESGGTPGLTTDMPGAIKFLTVPDGSGTLTLALTIEPDQDLLMTGDLYLADGQNLGFTAASGANTACDTTCTTGCVAGFDAGTTAFVACSSALADTCLCTK